MVWSTHHTMLGMVSQSKTTMAASLRKVLVIVGTTGAGKTKLSVDLAKAVNGEIINSDAMQMYRGLDIATAKITEAEKQGIPHHLFDVVDPSSRCDVLEFKRMALNVIDDVLARGKVPIIVGGTMYYTQSILWKSQLLDDVPVQSAVAESSASFDESQTAEELFDHLRRVDPVMASRLHINNKRKVLRSLEVFYQTGAPHSEHIERQAKESLQTEKYFDACALWVHCSKKDVLTKRLADRVATMVETGLVDEIKALRLQVSANPPRFDADRGNAVDVDGSVGILQAIGYKEFQPYLEALGSHESASCSPTDGSAAVDQKQQLDEVFDDCLEQLNVATRQYARRQLSWIRNRFVPNNIPVYQVDSSDVSQWQQAVATPAIQIARDFLAGLPIEAYKSLQEARPEEFQATSLEDKYVENVCEICGDRKFTGKRQWEEHLRSKGHKYHIKRVAIEAERNKNENADIKRHKSADTRTEQNEKDE